MALPDEVDLIDLESDSLTESDDESTQDLATSDHQIELDSDRAKLNEYVLEHTSKLTKNRVTRSSSRESSQRIIDMAREYQQELFDKAKEENIIAVLDTGSGKTLIAALLIRHYLELELLARSENKPRKLVFFLVPSVHLAQQQARVLSNNLMEKVVPLFGDSSDNLWKKADWDNIYKDISVVVCTPAILDSCLMHSYLDMGKISLLIFDEAHHCKKRHPYSTIIRDYYLTCSGERPRIFGMTASPVDSKRDIVRVVEDLESMLQSKIATTNDLSITAFAPRATDARWIYAPLHAEQENRLASQLMPLCGFVDQLKPHFRFARLASQQLGLWAADNVWKRVFLDPKFKSMDQTALYSRKLEKTWLVKDELEAKTDLVNEAISVVQQYPFRPVQLEDDRDISPKVRKLYEELKIHFSSGMPTRAIVFVEERMTANILCDLFESLAVPSLRPGALVGTATSGNEGNSWKAQHDTMEKFRSGAINCIFATSVAEEGIDIPQCNLVVRFDLYKTPIQYMQSRGRARMQGSIFAHMIEEGNHDHIADVDYAIAQDEYIRRFCQQLPPDRLLGHGSQLKRLMAQDATCPSFKTKTGTICNFENALLLLNRYVDSLSKIGATSKEVYKEIISEEKNKFQYSVILPATNNEKAAAVKGAKGEMRTNKSLAKRSAAWYCLVKLRHQQLLDENLDSIFTEIKVAGSNAKIAVNQKQDDYDKKIKPDFWVRSGVTSSVSPTKLFATHVLVEPRTTSWKSDGLLLFTRSSLPETPDFPVYVDDNVEKTVSFRRYEKPVSVSSEQITALTTYTLNGIFSDMFNKTFVNDPINMSYWLAPPTKTPNSGSFETLVNESELRAAATAERKRWIAFDKNNDIAEWCNAFLVDPGSGKFRYFSEDVAPGRTIFDPTPESAFHIPKRYNSTVIEFSDSAWRAKSKDFEQEIAGKYDKCQPVLNARIVMAGRSYTERCLQKNSRYALCLIAPQPLEKARISYSVAQTSMLWPSILHRLESYLIVGEALEKLNLTQVTLDLALEAFTQDSTAQADTENFEAESPDGQTENGDPNSVPETAAMNYERLEFIGDSLLKMMTTITVFLRTTCNEEGMHVKRMHLISNANLFSTASAPHLELTQYIRSMGEKWRDTWYPEHLKSTGKGRKIVLSDKHRKHALSKKTIADVCEALIGASIMTTRDLPIKEKFDLGIKAITKLVNDPDHAIESWNEILPMYQPAPWVAELNDPIANNYCRKVYEATGYRFKHPRLVRSAFTHSSDQNSPVQDLQRLEFLGDACLDWVCIWWLFSTNPTKDPQWLTEHKMAMVSNKFLAALAVILGFDKFVYATSPAVYVEIENFARLVREAWADPEVKPDFWTRVVTGSNVPKVLADLVESYLGAVLVDSGFDFREIENFFEKHVKRHFENIEAYDTYANRHPTTYMMRLLNHKFQCRKFRLAHINAEIQPRTPGFRDNEVDEEEADGAAETKGDEATVGTLYHVGWMVHGQVVAVSQGTGIKYANARASKSALKKLDRLTVAEFRAQWKCDCEEVREQKAKDKHKTSLGPTSMKLVEKGNPHSES
jgi:endoribonuclease Dicer